MARSSSVKARKPEDTLMFREAAQSAGAIARQFERNATTVRRLADDLRASPPRFIVTSARGSSDHAATFAKYIFETQLGIVTASAAPSVSSLYGTTQDLADVLFIAISQSGRSPDLLRQAESARAAGARVITLVNSPDAPLTGLADTFIDLHAGPENSVAATKSYLCSLAAILNLAAHWKDDAHLLAALRTLPERLSLAWNADWSGLVEALVDARNLFVLARGFGLGAAQEAALKFKETCGLHAEAFSGAEVMHGPMTLVGPGFPILCFTQDDETRPGLVSLSEEFRARGANVLIANDAASGPGILAVPAIGHAACTPLLEIQSFYRAVNALALRRGRDPDAPPSLRKVTRTV
ncbi:MAG TPA: SIS domain-containing protein [Steroidobacteraceae bacterium]|jgi:glucosamine--fructose-6-phosphate aminotransferase (isomerizing)